MKRVLVKPKSNQTVFNPASGRNIDEHGAMVIFDSYWTRRQMDNEIDVIETAKKVDVGEKLSQNLGKKRGKK
jgi:hypothetical protein